MHRRVTIAAVLTFTFFVAGCASTPPPRLYTLNARGGPAATSSNLSIAVGPVSVPAVVDRPQIVVDMGPNQVRLEEFNRWAAPLQNNIARVVADNLVLMLGTPRVTSSVQPLSADADYRAAVDVQSFQSVPGEAAMLDAVWTVRRTQGWQGRNRTHHRARDGARKRLRCARRRPQPRARAAEPGHRRRRARARAIGAVGAKE